MNTNDPIEDLFRSRSSETVGEKPSDLVWKRIESGLQKEEKKKQKEAKAANGSKPASSSSDPVQQLIDEGTKNINMYAAPVIQQPTDVPVKST